MSELPEVPPPPPCPICGGTMEIVYQRYVRSLRCAWTATLDSRFRTPRWTCDG